MKAFIITRDRVSYTRKCVASLARFFDVEPVIVDHGSTYPPMLEWLDLMQWTMEVHKRESRGPRDLWSDLTTLVRPNERFIVTDCDIVIPESVPSDVIKQLIKLLDLQPSVVKTGLALRIDDLPHNELTKRVIQWEQQFWRNTEYPWPNIFKAPIDTTFALYRSLSEISTFELGPAYRLGGEYSARHMPWYETGEETIDVAEAMWYKNHALPGTTNWSSPETYP